VGILERYEARAAVWAHGERAPELLEQNEMEMLKMFAWCVSEGSPLPDGVSDSLIDFINKSIKAYDARPQQRGLGNVLRERDYCERCAAKYMVGNLYWCTDCRAFYCIDCAMTFPKAENGNRRDSCGGELVCNTSNFL